VHERLRELPSVEEVAAGLSEFPRPVAVAAAREEIEARRQRILAGEEAPVDGLQAAVARRAEAIRAGGLRQVINATGVVLHTNLGRAPLASEAAESAARISTGYSNLELDLETGQRGSRQTHLEPLLRGLTGAEAAIAVNNNAAAVMLALAALAGDGEVVVSRGELVEIGDSFRIPEILAQSGARLVEVGTTNRTRIEDYADAIGSATAAILEVHQSNFRTVGFVEKVPFAKLAALARERGVALISDLGSGALEPIGDEPPVPAAVEAGADVVCFSADKLLGGPQAGVMAGRGDAIAACRRHPLARALRLDKLQLAALEATLRLHRDRGPDAIPALRMLGAGQAELRTRAEAMAATIGPAATVGTSTSRPGGGSLPTHELEGPVCEVEPPDRDPEGLLVRLRASDPPVIARIHEGVVLLDPRTMSDAEAQIAAAAVAAALG